MVRLSACLCWAIAAAGCSVELSELDVSTVHVSANNSEDYGAYVLVAWGALEDGSCPKLSSRTAVTVDGIELEPEFLGGKRWAGEVVPYRRCVREARFKSPAPASDGKSHIQLSDGKKTITVDVEALRAPTECRLPGTTLVRGQHVKLECSPATHTVRRAEAGFGETKWRRDDVKNVELDGNTFSFVVPDTWSGRGLLTLNVEFDAPVVACTHSAECVAWGRKIEYASTEVEVRDRDETR